MPAYWSAPRRNMACPPIIVAIIGVETLYGRNTGKFPTIQALSTLAFDFLPHAAYCSSDLTIDRKSVV